MYKKLSLNTTDAWLKLEKYSPDLSKNPLVFVSKAEKICKEVINIADIEKIHKFILIIFQDSPNVYRFDYRNNIEKSIKDFICYHPHHIDSNKINKNIRIFSTTDDNVMVLKEGQTIKKPINKYFNVTVRGVGYHEHGLGKNVKNYFSVDLEPTNTFRDLISDEGLVMKKIPYRRDPTDREITESVVKQAKWIKFAELPDQLHGSIKDVYEFVTSAHRQLTPNQLAILNKNMNNRIDEEAYLLHTNKDPKLNTKSEGGWTYLEGLANYLDDKNLKKLIKLDPQYIGSIKNPSEELQLEAIKKNPYVINLMTNPTARIKEEAEKEISLKSKIFIEVAVYYREITDEEDPAYIPGEGEDRNEVFNVHVYCTEEQGEKLKKLVKEEEKKVENNYNFRAPWNNGLKVRNLGEDLVNTSLINSAVITKIFESDVVSDSIIWYDELMEDINEHNR